jgi:hypothetical protein
MAEYFAAIEKAVAQAFPDRWTAYSRRGGAINIAARQRGVLNSSVPYEAAMDNRNTWRELQHAVSQRPHCVPKLRADGVVSCDGDTHQSNLKLQCTPPGMPASGNARRSWPSLDVPATSFKLSNISNAARRLQVQSHKEHVAGTVDKSLERLPRASEKNNHTCTFRHLDNHARGKAQGGQVAGGTTQQKHGLCRSEIPLAGELGTKPRTLEERSRFRTRPKPSRLCNGRGLRGTEKHLLWTRDSKSLSPQRDTGTRGRLPGVKSPNRRREVTSARIGSNSGMIGAPSVICLDRSCVSETCQGHTESSLWGGDIAQSASVVDVERAASCGKPAPAESRQSQGAPSHRGSSAPLHRCSMQEGGVSAMECAMHVMGPAIRPATSDATTLTPSITSNKGQDCSQVYKKEGSCSAIQGDPAATWQGSHLSVHGKPRHKPESRRKSDLVSSRRPDWEASTLLEDPLSQRLQASVGRGDLPSGFHSCASVTLRQGLSRVKTMRTAVKEYLQWQRAELHRLRQHRLDMERTVHL